MMNAQITIKRGLSLFLLVFLASPGNLRAQSGWTVDDCMRYAVEQNYRVRNSRLDTRIAGEDLTAAYGDFLPSVSATGALGKRLGRSVDPKTNLYTSSSFLESTMGLNVSLPVFDGFTRVNRLQFRKLNKQIGGLTEQIEENRIAFEVMDAFYRLCFDKKMYELAVEQRKLSERYHEQMLEYVDLGMRSPSDLQEVKARLQSDIYQETVKANGCRLSLLALKELLNMRDTDTLAISPDGEGEFPVLPVLESNEIYAASETSLPEFRAMELREKASRKSLAIASGAFSPSISAEFSLYSGYYDTERDDLGEIIPIKDQLKNNMNKYIGRERLAASVQRTFPPDRCPEGTFPPAKDTERERAATPQSLQGNRRRLPFTPGCRRGTPSGGRTTPHFHRHAERERGEMGGGDDLRVRTDGEAEPLYTGQGRTVAHPFAV